MWLTRWSCKVPTLRPLVALLKWTLRLQLTSQAEDFQTIFLAHPTRTEPSLRISKALVAWIMACSSVCFFLVPPMGIFADGYFTKREWASVPRYLCAVEKFPNRGGWRSRERLRYKLLSSSKYSVFQRLPHRPVYTICDRPQQASYLFWMTFWFRRANHHLAFLIR